MDRFAIVKKRCRDSLEVCNKVERGLALKRKINKYNLEQIYIYGEQMSVI